MGGFLQLKYAIAIIIAFSIDALQFLLGVAIAAAFFHPATALAIVGCVVSSTYVAQGSCWLGAAAGGIAGAIAGTVFPPLIALSDAIGAGLAALVDFCLSMVGMAIVIPMLVLNGVVLPGKFFSSWRRTPFIIAKIIPGLDMLPFFTGMVIMSIIETEASKRVGKPTGVAAAATSAGTALRGSAPATGNGNRAARYTFAQTRDIRADWGQQAEHTAAAHVPLVDRIQTAKQNPDSVAAQNLRSAARKEPNQMNNSPSPHVLNLAS